MGECISFSDYLVTCVTFFFVVIDFFLTILLSWSIDSGVAEPITGSGHTNQVTCIDSKDGRLVSCGMDDSVRTVTLSTKSFRFSFSSVSLDGSY